MPREPPDDPGNRTVHFHGGRRSNTAATGTAEWDAVEMRRADVRRGTVGGEQFRAIDLRTTRLPGYAVSQQKRKLVEQVPAG